MTANVKIIISDNGTDIPNEIVEAIKAMMRYAIKTARVVMIIDNIEYTIDYVIEK